MTQKPIIAEPVDFISRYLNFVGTSEAPLAFHRWSAIGGIGAMLGKSVWFEQGSFRIYPNLYVQLFGEAGARKSTSIKLFSKLLKETGFKDFSVEKTSKEKFIEWMADRNVVDEDSSLWGEIATEEVCNVFITADEFNDFFSTNILDFLSFLGVMWDYEGNYEHSTRSGGNVLIGNPCISILSGNTPTTLAKTIPPEAIGQGFFSRVVIVHGEPTGIKIAFPPPPCPVVKEALIKELEAIRTMHTGAMQVTPIGKDLLEYIYMKWKGIEDPRFNGYGNRRFNQLLKLSIIHTLAAHSTEIDIDHILRANTVLTRAEHDMSKALGEFGASRNALIINRISQILDKTTKPMSAQELWAQLNKEVDSIDNLISVMRGMIEAEKIMLVDTGFLPRKEVVEVDHSSNETLDWAYLSAQEQEIKL